nr:hypothetical protein [Haloferax sp. Atlit-12N]
MAATLGQQLFVVVDYLLLCRIGALETLVETGVRATKRLVLALEGFLASRVGGGRRATTT